MQLIVVSVVAHSVFFGLATTAYRFTGRKKFHIQVHAKIPNSGARIVFKPFVQSKKQKEPVLQAKLVASKKVVPIQKPKPKKAQTTLRTDKKKTVNKNIPKKKLQPVKKKAVAKKQPLPQKIATKKAQAKQIHYINQKELEALHVQTKIQQAIRKQWKPPIGLSKELACTISITVSSAGHITAATVTKSSGILIYDIAARSAVAQLSIPASIRNQTFSITFKQ